VLWTYFQSINTTRIFKHYNFNIFCFNVRPVLNVFNHKGRFLVA
jgi:hypothetical protein